jgi:amidophosphoribosyltransferase
MSRFSNVYGIDMPSRSELVAHERDASAIASAIGADLVIFQTLPDLISAVSQFNSEVTTFDCSVFSGEYVTGGVDEAYLQHLEQLRSDKSKVMARSSQPSDSSNGIMAKDVISDNLQGSRGLSMGCSGPMNGADDTVGLYNSFTASR